MEKKLKDPMGVLLDSLETFKAATTGKIDLVRKTALTTELEGFTIDTCDTVDAGWETGIKPEDKVWIIVERYEKQSLAEKGHAKWVKSLTDNPAQKLPDVQYNIGGD